MTEEYLPDDMLRAIIGNIDDEDTRCWVGSIVWWNAMMLRGQQKDKEMYLLMKESLWEGFYDRFVARYNRFHNVSYQALNDALAAIGRPDLRVSGKVVREGRPYR